MARIPQETIKRFIQTHDQILYIKYCTFPNSNSLDSVNNMPHSTLSLFTDPFSTISVGIITLNKHKMFNLDIICIQTHFV